jgi:hypothetical protein
MNKCNIAYVASTVPVEILNKKINNWKIFKIYVEGNSLLKSYNFLLKKFPKIKIIQLPENKIFNYFYLIFIIFRIKILKKKIYFFHECCCTAFDIIIGYLNPYCNFYPQGICKESKNIKLSILKKNKIYWFLLFTGLIKNFVPCKIYYNFENKLKYYIVWIRKIYPSNVKIFLPKVSKIKKISKKKRNKDYNALILLGSEFFPNKKLIKCFNIILSILMKLKVKCYIKDHPNPSTRTGFYHTKAIVINPFLPVELLRDKFDFIFGFATNSMVHFSSKSISVAYLIKNISPLLRATRINYLKQLPNGNLVQFPRTFGQLKFLIKNKLKIK